MAVDRDVEAVARASGYERHGTTFLGGSFASCTCPKEPCGGVSGDRHRADCPEHRGEPAQVWHWAAECPAQHEAGRAVCQGNV
jgi:hypothetical protein